MRSRMAAITTTPVMPISGRSMWSMKNFWYSANTGSIAIAPPMSTSRPLLSAITGRSEGSPISAIEGSSAAKAEQHVADQPETSDGAGYVLRRRQGPCRSTSPTSSAPSDATSRYSDRRPARPVSTR